MRVVLQSLMERGTPWVEVEWVVCGQVSSAQVGFAESLVDSGRGLERIDRSAAW